MIFIQYANIDLCFVLDATAVEEGQGGCQGLHLILDSQEPDQNSGKERRVLFSHKLPFVVSVCLPFLEICGCCGDGNLRLLDQHGSS